MHLPFSFLKMQTPLFRERGNEALRKDRYGIAASVFFIKALKKRLFMWSTHNAVNGMFCYKVASSGTAFNCQCAKIINVGKIAQS